MTVAISRTNCETGMSSRKWRLYFWADLRPLRVSNRKSGPMPEYVTPMLCVSSWIFFTDESSTSTDGSFFSVAITTPFFAGQIVQRTPPQDERRAAVAPTFDAQRRLTAGDGRQRVLDLDELATRAERRQREGIAPIAHDDTRPHRPAPQPSK